jgi:hypothetical protein
VSCLYCDPVLHTFCAALWRFTQAMTLADTCIFLLALGDNCHAHNGTSAQRLVLRLLQHGKVPFLALKEIVAHSALHHSSLHQQARHTTPLCTQPHSLC